MCSAPFHPMCGRTPAICLFAGAGLEYFVLKFRLPTRRRNVIATIVGVLLILALGSLARDIAFPYQTKKDREMSRLADEWISLRDPAGGVWLKRPFNDTPFDIDWYLLKGVAWDRSRIYDLPAVPPDLDSHAEWWVLETRAEESGAPSSQQSVFAAHGYAPGRSLDISFNRSNFKLQQWRRDK